MAALRIYCCENFGPDVKVALCGGRLGGAQCRTFTSNCGRPPLTWGDVRRICGTAPAILMGGECLAHLGPPPDDMRGVLLLKRPRCTALICGDYSFERHTAAGSYMVTAGWLDNWRSTAAGRGGGQSTGAEFIAENCDRITLLDTGSDPGSKAALGEFGEFVQRPVEVVPVGLELLTLQLEKAGAELERQEKARLESHAPSASLGRRRGVAKPPARAVCRNLKQSGERYRLLFEQMGNGFALLETLLGPAGAPADFRFVEVNPAFEAFAGKKAEELVGRTVLELLPGFDHGQMESLGQLAREGVPMALECCFLSNKCCQVWLFRPKPGYCGMIINDITKQKLLEDKLRQSIKMESVGRLAGGVAHDFNNMLSVIIGYAELLSLEYRGNTRISDSLREICKAAQHSRDITAQLLCFSGQQLISPRTVDLKEAMAELGRKASLLAGEGTRVSLALSDDLWKVRIDPAQLDMIISNIVRNAGAAMPDGGELAIETRNLTVGEEQCSGNVDAIPGDYVEIAISDSGHGMDSETCKHVFEPFFTTREVGQGSGLGLATVYGMVTQNRGFVNVSSARGVGTTLRVCLPRFQDRVVEARTLQVAPGSETVLVIEDDEIVGKMTAKMLEHMGYQVLMAENSVQAVEICRAEGNRIDLVLSDVMLPGASGKEAVDEILTLRPELKIIYMSGYAPETVLEKGVDRTRINFIQKPFDMASLGRMIKSALSGGGASA